MQVYLFISSKIRQTPFVCMCNQPLYNIRIQSHPCISVNPKFKSGSTLIKNQWLVWVSSLTWRRCHMGWVSPLYVGPCALPIRHLLHHWCHLINADPDLILAISLSDCNRCCGIHRDRKRNTEFICPCISFPYRCTCNTHAVSTHTFMSKALMDAITSSYNGKPNPPHTAATEKKEEEEDCPENMDQFIHAWHIYTCMLLYHNSQK